MQQNISEHQLCPRICSALADTNIDREREATRSAHSERKSEIRAGTSEISCLPHSEML